jgi:hypothetical protein
MVGKSESGERSFVIKDELLPLQYQPGMGAWTFHLEIPSTQDLKGAWGKLKVSGTLDGLVLTSHNLFSRKGKNKLLSINKELRNALQKSPGDCIRVTLFLDKAEVSLGSDLLVELAKELGCLPVLESRSTQEKVNFLNLLNKQASEEGQVQLLLSWLEGLEKGQK